MRRLAAVCSLLALPAIASAQGFVGRPWVSVDPSAPPGTLRIFLADGTLLMDSCGETYRLARWTTPRPGRVEWSEDGARVEAEVSEPRAGELRLRLRLRGGDTKDERYRLATVPYVCRDSRPDPGPASITVSGELLFLERMALPRTATIRVELRDVGRLDAPARTLVGANLPTAPGPPFAFSLSVPATAIHPRANLVVFAEIRDGRRLLFVTDTRHAVPPEGATGMQVRLRFVGGSARP